MKPIHFAIAQMNPTVGDYPANAAKIVDWIDQAEARGADVIVFPEVALSGYPVWDLANKKRFIDEGLTQLKKIIASTLKKKITVCVGFIDRPAVPGGRSYNALAWIQKGKLLHKQYKRLLPTYDVFLEDIFFEPGEKSHAWPWKDWKIGASICEDIWDTPYPVKPLKDLKSQKANLFINISASPYYRGVSEARKKLLRAHATRYKTPMLYVNQVGAQDDLIFDGRSMFCDASGKILFEAPPFKEELYDFQWDPASKQPAKTLRYHSSEDSEMYEALTLGIRDYCRKNRFKKAIIGLSGGIDSALVAALAVDALGAEKVTGVTMPGTYSSEGSWKDSEDLAKRLGVQFRVYPIREKYQFMRTQYEAQKKTYGLPILKSGETSLATENLQARLRGLELMFISNDEGHLLLTTGNKSELAMGYCTLYGDMAGGLAVIGDLYKTDVYRLCRYRNLIKEVIPKAILEKAPSAELRPNQTDQDSLPPYEILDEILYLYIEQNKSRDEIIRILKKKAVAEGIIKETIRKVDHNEYKRRQTPPVLRVTKKAWFGRRMPITNHFEN